ncbi:cyclic di-AMP binding protein CbpA [Fructobacillus sp. M1-13]|uniref:CBS domain-containing protein n=1 Tax=Fructobacillus papyriferae TaxID=2713171 RepID=A0ABS5QQW7_9LACO|nr:cyclic di-AMP binding protein CbpA [Fructobacillus papyriferae]MBS9335593.1 CBS domain-containing protein [Fructobacillus papyriferae]MCD2159318.1 cyclic di-AMP binding protein CbpA [Fructobacillus papyriferae]
MFPKSLIIKKQDLLTITEDSTIKDAYDIFEHAKEGKHLRTIPILDQTGHLFRGNIYRQHVYECVAAGGDLSQKATTIMRNSTKFISTQADFYQLFFAIRDLPYIAVVDEGHHFVGILTHAALMDLLSKSWSLAKGGVAIAVKDRERRGDLSRMARIITRYTNIESVLSLQVQNQGPLAVLFTLPLTADSPVLRKIITKLERKRYYVVAQEDLAEFM